LPRSETVASPVVTYQLAPEQRAVVVAGDLADLPGTLAPVGSLSAAEIVGTSFPQYLGVSQEVVEVHLAGRNAIIRMENDGSHFEVASQRLASDGASAYAGPVIGNAILIDARGTRNRIEISREAGVPAELYLSPTAEVSTPLFDGENVSWLQLEGRVDSIEFSTVELWSSPWTEDPALLVPRPIATLEIMGPTTDILAGGGYVVVRRDDTSRWVYRLADGYRALVTTPPRTTFDQAGPDEFVGGPYGAPGTPYGVPYLDFMRYDALTYSAP
jgi:hypothetical protein